MCILYIFKRINNNNIELEDLYNKFLKSFMNSKSDELLKIINNSNKNNSINTNNNNSNIYMDLEELYIKCLKSFINNKLEELYIICLKSFMNNKVYISFDIYNYIYIYKYMYFNLKKFNMI